MTNLKKEDLEWLGGGGISIADMQLRFGEIFLLKDEGGVICFKYTGISQHSVYGKILVLFNYHTDKFPPASGLETSFPIMSHFFEMQENAKRFLKLLVDVDYE